MGSDSSDDFLQSAWRDMQAPYDGVRGELPDWIPENFHREFHAIRSRLQDHSHIDLLGFVAEVRSIWEGSQIAFDLTVPLHIHQEILTLAHFQEAVRRGKEAGLALLTDPDHSKHVTLGENYRQQQSDKASKPRGKVSDNGETLSDIIARLARTGPQEESAKELWPAFYGELDRRQLNPREVEHPTDPKKSTYEYEDAEGARKCITFGHFANVVSSSRTKKKSG